MRGRYERLARLGATALGLWTNEGTRLVLSCSPSQSKADSFDVSSCPCVLRARKRWPVLLLRS